MNYPFNTKAQYFSSSEKKHIDAFIKSGPKEGWLYDGGSGEKRTCVRIFLPTGAVTELTVFADERLADHSINYHTPTAILTDTREAKIIYSTVKDGKVVQESCLSSEWNKWFGGKGSGVAPGDPEVTETEKSRISAMVKMHKNTGLAEPEDEHSKGAQWISASNKK